MTQVAKHEVPKSESQASSPAPSAVTPLPAKPLKPADLGLTEFTTRHFTLTLDEAQFAQVFDPLWWSNVSDRMRQGDIVAVHSPNGNSFSELHVRRVHKAGDVKSKPGVVVGVLHQVRFAPIESEATQATAPAYRAQWLGPNRNWGVIRVADQVVMVSDLPDEDAAVGHLRAMTRPPTK
jgi:hypothetical protein